MSVHPSVPLGEVCAVNPRRPRHAVGSGDLPVSFVPMAAVDERLGEITGQEDRPLAAVARGFSSFQTGDVLFAKITPCMENGKIAVARDLTNRIGRGSTEFYVLRPGEAILSDYLFYYLRQRRFRQEAKRHFVGTAGQQRVPKSFIENARIPLPPLDEQRRIVAILNRAARIERLRARAAERLREFVPALFVEMFGDPVENPMGWPKERLGVVVGEFRYGTSGKCSTKEGPGDLPVLRIPNVVGGVINWGELKFRGLEGREAESLQLMVGDILFVRTNGNPNYIGRCAVFEGGRPAAFASYLIRARLIDGTVRPRYLADVLGLPSMRRVLLSLARTTAGNYNISIGSLVSLVVPLPPLELQLRYERHMEKEPGLLLRAAGATTEAESLSDSMMANLLGSGSRR